MAQIVQLIKDSEGFMSLSCLSEIPEQYINANGSYISYRQIAGIMEDLFSLSQKATEYIYSLAFDSRMKLLGIMELGHGSEKEVHFELRDLFAGLILMRASRFILVHNHVHGFLEPSKADRAKTEEAEKLSKLLGMEFLNHIVVGDGNFKLIKDEP
ncbi:MAG: JAB domain-containing protein [Lachnospiraceae bacterium]|nr:JAB domain-containing protein [Lachnospiraceae bacterium]